MVHCASPLSRSTLAARAAAPMATVLSGSARTEEPPAASEVVRAPWAFDDGTDGCPPEQAADHVTRRTSSDTLAMTVSGWPAATIGRNDGLRLCAHNVANRIDASATWITGYRVPASAGRATSGTP